MERELDAMTASCDKARRSAHRDRVLLSESRIQSSELQVEMREDVEARCRGTQTCGTCAPFVAQGYVVSAED